MGFFSKIVKGIKKVVKKIGKGIKSVFKKVGKFMGKLGFVGQLALGLIMPYALPALGGMLGGFATSLMKTSGSGFLASAARGAGQFLNAAVKVGTRVGQVFKSVTQAVTKTMGQMVGATINKIPGAGDLLKGLTGGRLDITQMDFSKAWEATQNAWTNAGDDLSTLFSKSTIDTSMNAFGADKLSPPSAILSEGELLTDASPVSQTAEFQLDPLKRDTLASPVGTTGSTVVEGGAIKLQAGDAITKPSAAQSLLAPTAQKATEGTLMSKAEELGSKLGDQLGVKDVTLAGAAELISGIGAEEPEPIPGPLTDYVDYSSLAIVPFRGAGMSSGLASATPVQFGGYGNSLVTDIMNSNWGNIYQNGMWGFPSSVAGITNYSNSAGQMVSGIGTDPRVV